MPYYLYLFGDFPLSIPSSYTIERQWPVSPTIVYSSIGTKKSPNLRYFRVFGCLVYLNVRLNNQHKFSNHSSEHIFIRYLDAVNKYMYYSPMMGQTILSRDVTLLEDDFSQNAKIQINSDPSTEINGSPNSTPIAIISRSESDITVNDDI